MSGVGSDQLARGSAARRQIIRVLQSGNNVDVDGSATGDLNTLFGDVVRGKGRIIEVFGINLKTALAGNATYDIVPYLIRPSRATPDVAGFVKPLIAATERRLTSAKTAGQKFSVVPAETEVNAVAQASAAGTLVGPAAWAYPDGWWVDAGIKMLSGDQNGHVRQATKFLVATDTISVDKNWLGAPGAGDRFNIRSRRLEVDAGDIIRFGTDFTVGTGAAGVDCLMGVVIEFYDRIDLF